MKKKILIISFTAIVAFCFVSLLIFLGLLIGKIQDYKYLKINNKNKTEVIELLKEQEENMFGISKDVDLDICYENLNKIEVIFLFPDGEDYTLYCNDNKFNFSLDSTNYNLHKYMGRNGKTWFRIRW